MSENSIDLTLILPSSSSLASQSSPTSTERQSHSDAARDIQSFFQKMQIRYEVLAPGDLPAGKIIFFLDSDLRVPLAEVIKFLSYFHDHPQTNVIRGTRFGPKSKLKQPFGERLATTLIGRNEPDLFCPFVAVRKEFFEPYLFADTSLPVIWNSKRLESTLNFKTFFGLLYLKWFGRRQPKG